MVLSSRSPVELWPASVLALCARDGGCHKVLGGLPVLPLHEQGVGSVHLRELEKKSVNRERGEVKTKKKDKFQNRQVGCICVCLPLRRRIYTALRPRSRGL